MTKNHKLDNPVWNSLNEVHRHKSVDYQSVKFYLPEYCPFGGAANNASAAKDISAYSKRINSFFIVGEKPSLDKSVVLHKDLVCNQMLLENQIDIEISEQIVELKEEEQKRDLFNLVDLVQPGYFKNKTADLGRYFGIYKEAKLVAVSGERMKMNEFTEISAIVTHPKYTRNGYAKQLIKHTADQVFYENKTPYLHVLKSNIHAVGLYEKLGFRTRRKISFWHLVKV